MEKKKMEIKKNAATGVSASLGAAVGVVGGSLLAGEVMAEEVPVNPIDQPDKPHPNNNDEPEIISSHDSEVRMATTVDDNMSFSEAFAAARAEVGPGGAFEWRGNVYGTYYETEWNSMTPEQKNEYYSHFSWGSSHHGGHQTPEPKPEPPAPGPEPPSPGPKPEPPTPPTTTPEQKIEVISVQTVTDDSGNQIDVASVKVDGHRGLMADADRDGKADILMVDYNDNGKIDDNETADVRDQGIEMPPVTPTPVGPTPPTNLNDLEVEVVSAGTVTDDDGNQMDVAFITAEGHQGLVADVDRDGKADVLVVDIDDSGTIEDNEILDLTNYDVEMASLVPQSDNLPDDIYYAQNDPDYVNDADVHEYFA